MQHYSRILAFAAPFVLAAADVHAAVVISSHPTENMSCAVGVCAPTAMDAVLNTGDLENLLTSGNIEVTTTGSGVQAKNIVISGALSWSASGALSLNAYESIAIDTAVSVMGLSGLSLTTNDGGTNGTLSFGNSGNVAFANLSSGVVINGTPYTLVNTISMLASAIASNSSGSYALANSYDASQDGTYSTVPISTLFIGTFEGFGNSISNLSIRVTDNETDIGLFAEIGIGAAIRDLGLLNANVTETKKRFVHFIGALAGFNNGGTIRQSYATGAISAPNANGGGLVGLNDGAIVQSYAADAVIQGSFGGGLVGYNDSSGTITQSYATGVVSGGSSAVIGGLTGINVGAITQCFSTGAVTNGTYVSGGLVGFNHDGTITQSYSAGGVDDLGYVGGLVGYDNAPAGSINRSYWDTDTSGIANLSQGAGSPPNDPGITGLTTEQFQSGLPKGFSKKVWNENSNINNGLPYLRANPPPK